jgi:hypothetical protein
MLKLAYPYAEALSLITSGIGFDPRLKYYQGGWITLAKELDKDTWTKMQFVSMDKEGGTILGYLSCSINRQLYYAHDVTVVNLMGGPHPVFAKDLLQFFADLLFKYNMNKVNWSVLVGNPAEKMYDKAIEQFGGRIVGVYKDECITWDHQICDEKLYELRRQDVKLKSARPLGKKLGISFD